jgi:hypothetical protein
MKYKYNKIIENKSINSKNVKKIYAYAIAAGLAKNKNNNLKKAMPTTLMSS